MPARVPDFSPVLKEGKTWCVEWYATIGDKRTRIRRSQTADGTELNAIADIPTRRAEAERLIEHLRRTLTPPDASPVQMPFAAAMQMAVDLKRSAKAKTNKTFGETARWLLEFMASKGWGSLRCCELRFDHVQAWFDHQILVLKIANSTHHTRKNNLRSLFSELVKRGHLPENYAAQVAERPQGDPRRRPMSKREEAIIADMVAGDRALCLAWILLRYLGIRPGEMRDLRCGALDLARGFVVFPGEKSKNNRNSVVTIPDEVLPVLRSFELEKQPDAYFVFGGGRNRHDTRLMPGPVRIGVNTLSGKFKTGLKRLKKEGKLSDITGLQFYSLKDSLAIHLLDNGVDPESAMRHLRQRDLTVFQRYVKRLGIENEKVRRMPVGVLPKWEK
jgi:integrase